MLTLLALLATSLSAPAPVAVAPWRNLSGDASLRFLEQGAAETMTADLRRAGVAVVERIQLEQALGSIPAAVVGDVERAVAAGRVVGARSVVVGSFQRQGGQLRLVARVVVVETAEVKEAGTATGAVDDVFALQDRVMSGLLGRAPPLRPTKPKLASYRKLGEALAPTTRSSSPSSSPSSLAAPLEQILLDDPDFSYAGDALLALEARLRAQGPVVDAALDERTRALLGIVEDKAAGLERRQQAARALLDTLQGAGRLRAVVAAADRILRAGVPTDPIADVTEAAAAARAVALLRLTRLDAGLAAAETYLAQHPAGAGRATVEAAMREAIERRRSEATRRRDFDEELRELAADLADAGAVVDRERQRSSAFKPCIAAKWSTLPSEMIVRCRSYLQRFGDDVDDDGRDHARSARAFIAWGHALRGDFAAARADAARLEQEIPGALDDTGLRSVMTAWSAD